MTENQTLFALDGIAPRPHLAARLGYALLVTLPWPDPDAPPPDPEAEAEWAAVVGPACTALFLHRCDVCERRWAAEVWLLCEVLTPEPEAGDLVALAETCERCPDCTRMIGYQADDEPCLCRRCVADRFAWRTARRLERARSRHLEPRS